MKALILVISLLMPFAAQADLATGMVLGMAMSGGDETVINIQDGGKPCFVSLKKTGGTFQLNANYIESMESVSIRGNCKSSGFLSQTCEQIAGTRISLVNKEVYKTFSSVEEVKEQIGICAGKGLK